MEKRLWGKAATGGRDFMEIFYALLMGAAIGGVWVLVALALLLQVVKRSDAKVAAALQAGEDGQAVNRQALNAVLKFHVSKYILDVLLLLALFLARGWLPFRWDFTLLGVGIMLTVFFQLLLACTGLNKRLIRK